MVVEQRQREENTERVKGKVLGIEKEMKTGESLRAWWERGLGLVKEELWFSSCVVPLRCLLCCVVL